MSIFEIYDISLLRHKESIGHSLIYKQLSEDLSGFIFQTKIVDE